jgi:hypothetical protein
MGELVPTTSVEGTTLLATNEERATTIVLIPTNTTV